MNQSFESILCTKCGLCCDGSLFSDVELSGAREAGRLELAGLEIEDDALLLQPCVALDGKRCSMYSHRPKCCRTFECRLLKRVRAGAVDVPSAESTISSALSMVKRIRTLLARLPAGDNRLPLKERCLDAISLAPENSAAARQLEVALTAFEEMAHKTFLSSDGLFVTARTPVRITTRHA
jgi:hypothetical protein